MNPLLRLVMVFVICFAFLVGVRLSGDRSAILLLPFAGGQLDAGQGWTVIMLVMLVGRSVWRRSDAGCQRTECECIVCLRTWCGGVFAVFAGGRCLCAGVWFGRCAAGLIAVCTAARTFAGRKRWCNGRLCTAGDGGNCRGAPSFYSSALIPFLFEGIYAIIRVACQAVGRQNPMAASLGEWLIARGLSGKTVMGGYAVLSLAGGIAAVAGAYFYL